MNSPKDSVVLSDALRARLIKLVFDEARYFDVLVLGITFNEHWSAAGQVGMVITVCCERGEKSGSLTIMPAKSQNGAALVHKLIEIRKIVGDWTQV